MPNRIIHILIAIFVWGNIAAQQKITLPQNKQYTLRDGLSQMQVTCLFQDSRGYLWIGTKAGLNCFNGEKFTSYTTKKYPEIASDYINQICEDSYGRIWASTMTGIFRVDGNKVRFFKVEANPMPWMAADDQGRLWFVQGKYPEIDINIRYIESDSIFTQPIEMPKVKWNPHLQLHFLKDEKKFLLAKDTILYKINGNKLELIDNNRTYINFILQKGEVYYLEGFKPEINSNWESHNFDLKHYHNGDIKRLARVRNGSYTSKTEIAEPIACSTSGPHSVPILLCRDSISYNGFENIQTSKILIDVESNFWLGSEEGLYLLYGKIFTAFSREYLPQVWAVLEDKNQSVWLSSFFFGLSKLENGTMKRYPNHFIQNAAFSYFHPVIDKRGRLFFPNGYGILMFDGRKFEQQGQNFFISTYYDHERDLVWGGKKKGVVAFDPNRKQVRLIDEKSGLEVGNNVLTIGKDTSGYYWFGGGAGLARYNWHTNKLKNYKPGNRSTGVYTQRNDYTGRTWFGTKDGLYWYNAKTDTLVKIVREELSDVVNMLEPIDSSWLIVSQPYGIYLLDLKAFYKNAEIRLHLFNEKNGFLGIEPGQDGAFTDSKGNVWMTTSTELMKLDPKKLKPDRNYLTVRIDKLNGQKLPFTSQNHILPQNQNSAVVTFDAICFNRPNPVQYSWKLESDTAWSAWQEEDYAVISGLKDGLSKIIVRAKIRGLPSTEVAQANIGIQVQLALYRQPWFFPTLFVFISLIGIFFLFIALLRMKKANREAKVFQIQAIQSQMNPHFIFNVLASLQSMILKANISKANDYLVKLADLIRGFLEASLGTGTIKSPKDKDGLVSISSELKMLHEFVEFQQIINPGKFEYKVVIEAGFDVENEFIPPMLIQPFVENAIRHGILLSKNRGLMELTFEKIGEKTVITVCDNGIGIQSAEKLLNKSPMRYTSRGKELTFQRIKLLNQLGFGIDTKTESDDSGTIIKIIIDK